MNISALHFPEFYEEAEYLKFSIFPLKILTKYTAEKKNSWMKTFRLRNK